MDIQSKILNKIFPSFEFLKFKVLQPQLKPQHLFSEPPSETTHLQHITPSRFLSPPSGFPTKHGKFTTSDQTAAAAAAGGFHQAHDGTQESHCVACGELRAPAGGAVRTATTTGRRRWLDTTSV